jgi:hypothetical protein
MTNLFTQEEIDIFIETRKYPKEFLLLFKDTCTTVPDDFVLPDYGPPGYGSPGNFKGKYKGKYKGDFKGKGKFKSKPKFKDNFKDNLVPLIKGENAWDPKKEITTENEKILKTINGTLNKLSELNFNKLSEKIMDTTKNVTLDMSVVDLIYIKCINQPNYIELYTRLIKCLNYKKLIIMKCQYEFKKESNWNCDETCKLVELSANEMESNEDEQNEFRKNKLKRNVFGNLNLIVSLYKFDLFSKNILEFILNSLLEKSNESEHIIEMICYLVNLLCNINFEINKYKNTIENITTENIRLRCLLDTCFN